jgi:hypothetical protein
MALGKKKTKELKQALQKKLDRLGVKSETTAKVIGKRPALTMQEGKVVETMFPVVQLQNMQRRMIKQLIAGGENVVRQFIAMSDESLRGTLNMPAVPVNNEQAHAEALERYEETHIEASNETSDLVAL